MAGLPAEVPDDLLPAPGDLCDTKQDAAFLDQNGLRSNLLAQQQELVSTGHKKEGSVLLGSGQFHVMRSAIA